MFICVSLAQNTIHDIEIAYVQEGYVFGSCIGYEPNERTTFIEKIEQKCKEYNWSIIKPIIEIKTLRKNDIVEYSLDTLKEWMAEL